MKQVLSLEVSLSVEVVETRVVLLTPFMTSLPCDQPNLQYQAERKADDAVLAI
jgi:hypothetical protein